MPPEFDRLIVTAASKSAETDDSAPATATTITAEDLQRHGLRTVADAVRFFVPGAIVEEIPNGSFGSRGVLVPFDNGSHVLVLVDGHTIDNELDGSVDLERGVGVPITRLDTCVKRACCMELTTCFGAFDCIQIGICASKCQ